MSYSKFTIEELRTTFGIHERRADLFGVEMYKEPSAWLLETLARGKKVSLISEKSKSEMLISPVLLEIANLYENEISLFSGANLDADKSKGLNGECDYLFSNQPKTYFPESSIFTVVEAKNDNIETGIVQCMAQMIGANIFNLRYNHGVSELYGCVTTGKDWHFLRLENQVITINTETISLEKLPQILGILDFIIQKYI